MTSYRPPTVLTTIFTLVVVILTGKTHVTVREKQVQGFDDVTGGALTDGKR